MEDGDAEGESDQAQENAVDPDKPLVHNITFWANQVFTVDDGRFPLSSVLSLQVVWHCELVNLLDCQSKALAVVGG
jgi:hypothetical protein